MAYLDWDTYAASGVVDETARKYEEALRRAEEAAQAAAMKAAATGARATQAAQQAQRRALTSGVVTQQQPVSWLEYEALRKEAEKAWEEAEAMRSAGDWRATATLSSPDARREAALGGMERQRALQEDAVAREWGRVQTSADAWQREKAQREAAAQQRAQADEVLQQAAWRRYLQQRFPGLTPEALEKWGSMRPEDTAWGEDFRRFMAPRQPDVLRFTSGRWT